ncbi:oleate hydratase [Vallitalea pronyensis]|uniref:Oleate hydratase n=1 Tax=Vallitalea pronyensis TaxID=1348613 RepID=A0A8J8MMA6_9FIRM|nr:oleate hydratase [Vallitalea pronyensis]QUI23913.1 oleate hydratase [Vallitalea pronyensis]
MMNQIDNRNVYFVGGGLASMAGAAYLIRDCKLNGENIHILEHMDILGGSNDGSGNPKDGFLCRGGRMLNEETYENFWELFSSIPSLEQEGKSVTDEILAFDDAHPTHSNARLIDKNGYVLDVMSMGFNMNDRKAMLKLMMTPEEDLDHLSIRDWFGHTPHFFETNFWYMWQTTFAFQKWSSLFEFRRYMNRMIFEFSRIQTLEGVTRTPYNQYESVILPLKKYLEGQGVNFDLKCTVTDLDFKEGEEMTVTGIHYTKDDITSEFIQLKEGDLCMVTNGCMTDNAALGDFKTPAPMKPDKPVSGELWRKIAAKKDGLGNSAPFFNKPEESNWESFTVTMKGNHLLNKIERFSRNVPGSGALMTFKDSKWLMSIVVAAQPHFKAQTEDETIFWGNALITNVEGDYVKKAIRDCSGEEILIELLHHLHFEDDLEDIMKDVINVIPCMMPYVDAQFQPRAMTDRPQVVPAGSTNFAMISQFVEIPEDMVFTEEYSVRAARIAVYTLMGLNKRICPVTPHQYDIRTLLRALNTSFR